MPSVDDKSRLKRLCRQRLCRPGLRSLRMHTSCLRHLATVAACMGQAFYNLPSMDNPMCANLGGIQGNLDQRIEALWLWDLKWARLGSTVLPRVLPSFPKVRPATLCGNMAGMEGSSGDATPAVMPIIGFNTLQVVWSGISNSDGFGADG